MTTSVGGVGRKEADAKQPVEPTSRGMRWLLGGLLLGVMYSRFPQTQRIVEEELSSRATDISPTLVGLAVSVAMLITFLGLPLVVAIYLSVARLLEVKLFQVVLAEIPRFPWMRVGLFVAVVFASMFPPQMWALLTGDLPSASIRIPCAAIVSLSLSLLALNKAKSVGRTKKYTGCISAVILAILITAV